MLNSPRESRAEVGSRSLKICFISPFPPAREGVADYLQDLARALVSRGADVTVLSQRDLSGPDQSRRAEAPSLDVVYLWRRNSLLDRLRIVAHVGRSRPDVVHFQYGPYSGFGWLLGEPFLLSFLLLRRRGARLMVTLHSFWDRDQATTRIRERTSSGLIARLGSMYYFAFMKLFLRLFDCILVCTNFREANAKGDVAAIFGLPMSRCGETVLPVPQPRNVFTKADAKRRLSLEGKTALLCFGFVRRAKGLENAIDALPSIQERFPNAVLLIVGEAQDHGYLAELKQRAARPALAGKVEFVTRYVSEEERCVYFSAADVLVLPYSKRVGPSYPLSLAVSFRRPVVAVNDPRFLSSSPPSIVKMFNFGDSESLVDAITEAMSVEMENIEALARSVVSDYSTTQVADDHIEIYRSMVQNR